MLKLHPLKELISHQKSGIAEGIYSVCSANAFVIEAAMERTLRDGKYVLIESTANQVNQFGGYTGMQPGEFKEFVFKLAKKTGFPKDKVILGGDHLGPLTWKNENSDTAMEKAADLIRNYISAGFTKIHIDTSMHLGDDDPEKILNTEIIAQRGAALCKSAEDAFKQLRLEKFDAVSPVYIIGSEVPIPGGSQDEEEGIHVTGVEDLEITIETFKKAFLKEGLEKAWENVIAVVVQPGVEFGDETIHEYNREAAKELSIALGKYPELVFEGHSTDYQTKKALKEMVEDGIAILKVGPALTFALREALFALNHMENELFKYNNEVHLSNFIQTLDNAMENNPENWGNHYHGTTEKIKYARKYSFSDRARYYLPVKEVKESVDIMLHNLKSTYIPITLISQFMPVQYVKIRNGEIEKDPESLLKDRIVNCIEDYMYAVYPDKFEINSQ